MQRWRRGPGAGPREPWNLGFGTSGLDQPGREVLPALTLDVVTQKREFRWCEEERLLNAGVRRASALTRVGRDDTPAGTPALSAPDRKPCLFAMVLPLHGRGVGTHFAIVISVTAVIGIEPNTGSMSRATEVQ